MCGRFAQAQTREEYLAYLADEADRDIAYDLEPIGRYNVAPGTKVLLLIERDEKLHLDPVFWGYAPGWWGKPPLKTRASRRRPLAECLNLSGSMAGQFASLMVGSNGRKKATRNSHTSFIAPTGSSYSWRRSAAHRLSAAMRPKGF